MSKPRPVFEEMPPHVKKMILNKLDLKTKVNCRLVNKSVKSLVESTEITIPEVELQYDFVGEAIHLSLLNTQRSYDLLGGPEVFVKYVSGERCRFGKYQAEEGQSVFHYALTDFRAILGTFPKVTIETFILNLGTEERLLETFENTFQENELNVKNLELKVDTKDFTKAVKRFQSGTLRFLKLSTYDPNASNVVKLDAFKKLRIFELESAGFTDITPNDIKHLDYCRINRIKGMKVEDAVLLKNECMKKPDGNTHIFLSDIDDAAFFREFGQYHRYTEWKFQNGESIFKMIHVLYPDEISDEVQ